MNIEDWLDNANLRLENRSVSYAALATADLPLALMMVRTVLDLHKPRQGHGMNPICDGCSDEDDDDAYLYYESGPIFTVWPCPTVRAIENTLKEYA